MHFLQMMHVITLPPITRCVRAILVPISDAISPIMKHVVEYTDRGSCDVAIRSIRYRGAEGIAQQTNSKPCPQQPSEGHGSSLEVDHCQSRCLIYYIPISNPCKFIMCAIFLSALFESVQLL